MCEIYFRVLKAAEASPAAADRPLLSPTLDGLTRVAHLIDYEVVADILEVRHVLRQCTATVSRSLTLAVARCCDNWCRTTACHRNCRLSAC